jgi:hypothetical protein
MEKVGVASSAPSNTISQILNNSDNQIAESFYDGIKRGVLAFAIISFCAWLISILRIDSSKYNVLGNNVRVVPQIQTLGAAHFTY